MKKYAFAKVYKIEQEQQIEEKDQQIEDLKARMRAYGKMLKDSGAEIEDIIEQTGLNREDIESWYKS